MNSPSIIKAIPNYVNGEKVLKRVVGYARVSTDEEKQDSSFNLQISQLEKDIKSNPDYQFLGVFKDKVSGRSTKGRDEFNLMIDLARGNEIDVIITKSISRFGRNLIDTLTIIRELRNIGVEIFFQKENVSTLDDSFDFLLSMLSAHAEEESKNISDNNNWSIRKRKQSGVNLTSKLYGYRIIKNEYIIIDEEARVISDIFSRYINGCTYREIITYLHSLNMASPTGNEYWSKATLETILTNEKYCGDMLLGRRARGHSEKGLAYVHHNHVGIIPRSQFELAQKVRATRSQKHFSTIANIRSPYTGWLFSTVNNKPLRYVLEKPKGQSGNIKSQIPTLYCYGKHEGSRRISFQVKVIIDMLNQVVAEIKSKFLVETNSLINSLKETSIPEENLTDYHLHPLIEKYKREQMLNKLKVIKEIFTTKDKLEISEYRKIFHRIIIDDKAIKIKISLSDDNNIDIINYL